MGGAESGQNQQAEKLNMDYRKVQAFAQAAIDSGKARVTPSGELQPAIHVHHRDGCRHPITECTCDPDLSFEDSDDPVTTLEVLVAPVRSNPISSN